MAIEIAGILNESMTGDEGSKEPAPDTVLFLSSVKQDGYGEKCKLWWVIFSSRLPPKCISHDITPNHVITGVGLATVTFTQEV